MKRFIYILFTFSLIFSSCNELELQTPTVEDGIVLTISNSSMTKVNDAGTDYEKKLNTVHFFFYPKGQTNSPCVFYHKEDFGGSTSGKEQVKIYVIEDAISKIFPAENTCEIFAIANLPEYLTPAENSNIFKDNSEYTRLDVLQRYILKLDDENDPSYLPTHDGVNKPFVMAGLGTAQKDSKKNATGSINLRRAASKVTISVAVPEYIDNVPVVENGVERFVRMVPPPFEQEPDISTMNAAFHNGTYKGYLYSDVDEAVDTFFIDSSKKRFKFSHNLDPIPYKNPEMNGRDSIPTRRVYTCEVPFYTYARDWEKGAADAAYMTFEMKWGASQYGSSTTPTYDTYYYQILINGGGRTFEPNRWYDMFVNVGVIGSAVELTPIIIDHLAFFVLDWSDETSGIDHPEEEVTLETYTYLNVDTPFLELNNVNIDQIHYDASHTIGWNVTSAYTFNNSGVNSIQENYTSVTKANFTKDSNGVLTYRYEMPSTQYSPIYINLDIWLDFNGNGTYDAATESEYLRHVEIIHYPAMYVVRDKSSLRSIYINGEQYHSTSNSMGNVTLGSYDLGSAAGVRNHDNGAITYNGKSYPNHQLSYSMFIISVSSFDSNDTFTAPVLNNNGYLNIPTTGESNENNLTRKEYQYIVGDPRVRTNVIAQNSGPYSEVKKDFAKDHNGNTLTYYYPTDGHGNTFQVVAPKFRIVSFNNASTKACDPYGAALRCATLQEDGIPAGRWRLPTVAEIKYIIKLQQAGAIQAIFTSGSSYYATAAFSNAAEDRLITLTLDGNSYIWNSLTSGISVRCVYDEWYWGSGREAVYNPTPSKRHNNNATEYRQDYLGNQIYFDQYYFTWGDKEIIW